MVEDMVLVVEKEVEVVEIEVWVDFLQYNIYRIHQNHIFHKRKMHYPYNSFYKNRKSNYFYLVALNHVDVVVFLIDSNRDVVKYLFREW